ncbi:HK97-gp10 family putative phage morphogenesis protein [Paludisphaera soli]|uniref:HK97-gp10 family putative phage morphogenesis protein n=1 Tax=Paludisphaera soli TaxID=2712865 RepID=UPI0013EB0368|nr:HK97-gp10 family putative phage morphogenesis protein [Paludisphaera soli]
MARRAGGGRGISLNVDGDVELIRALSSVAKGVQKRVLRRATRAGMDVVTRLARQFAPVLTGRLRAAIKTVDANSRGPWRVRTETRVGAGDFKGVTFYAAIVEFGSKRSRPRPYLTPAFESGKGDALRIARAEILDGVEAEIYAAAFRRTGLGRIVARAERAAGRASRTASRAARRGRKAARAAGRSARRTRKRATKAAKRTRRTVKRASKRLGRSASRVRKRATRATKRLKRTSTRRTRSARRAAKRTTKRLGRTSARAAKRLKRTSTKATKRLRKWLRKALRPSRRRRRRKGP